MLRGLVACGFGPAVLAIVYLAIEGSGVALELGGVEVALGIFSLSALAFISGGMAAIYQVEKLPLLLAILLHGGALYLAYLVTYLVNSWLEDGLIPILVFSGIFVVGYVIIWAIIYLINRRRIAKINTTLKLKQEN